MEKLINSILIVLPLIFVFTACQSETAYDPSEEGFKKFISSYESVIEPLSTQYNQAQWNAYTTGEQPYYDASTKASLEIDAFHQNTDHFNYLKKLRSENVISDPLLKRQLDLLFKTYAKGQIEPELNKQITELASKLESVFANFRTIVDGKTYSDNQVTQILQKEKNLGFREKIWRAQKAIGAQIGPDLVQLVKLRNKAARDLGYANYFEMSMDVNELDSKEVSRVFDELYELTQTPFTKLHGEIEQVFANRYGIEITDIRPWHYEDLFAQQAPSIFEINLDDYYMDTDIPVVATEFYASANIDVRDILERSDLYEREGKSQHAFSFFIDRKNDIRVLCNLVPNERWMETMLHELGHASYDKYLDPSLPFLLREPAHQFTTEGIAMFFGSYASNAGWMKKSLQISEKEKKRIESVTMANLRLSKIIFARWSMVVFNFEKSLYLDPDQDLNSLWWNLVEKYQMIRRPEKPVGSEWATKLHIATYPVYYQNYQLGELFATQILNYLAINIYNTENLEEVIFWDQPAAGDYIKENIFKPGKIYPWKEMIEKATGEPLSARFFVNTYVTNE